MTMRVHTVWPQCPESPCQDLGSGHEDKDSLVLWPRGSPCAGPTPGAGPATMTHFCWGRPPEEAVAWDELPRSLNSLSHYLGLMSVTRMRMTEARSLQGRKGGHV